MTVSFAQPWTVTLPTMLEMRIAASIPSGSRRSTFFWAKTCDDSNTIAAATTIAMTRSRPRWRLTTRTVLSAATGHLGAAPQQIDFLAISARQHLDQRLVGGVARESVPRFQDRLVDGAEARLQLRDRLRRERCFLLIEHVLQDCDVAQIIVLFDCERGERRGRCRRRRARRARRADARRIGVASVVHVDGRSDGGKDCRQHYCCRHHGWATPHSGIPERANLSDRKLVTLDRGANSSPCLARWLDRPGQLRCPGDDLLETLHLGPAYRAAG